MIAEPVGDRFDEAGASAISSRFDRLFGCRVHGHDVVAIHLLSDEALRVEEGSLYPALYRLELDGAITAKWGLSENHRKAKYYEITRRGRQLMAQQQETWSRLSVAVDRVLAR